MYISDILYRNCVLIINDNNAYIRVYIYIYIIYNYSLLVTKLVSNQVSWYSCCGRTYVHEVKSCETSQNPVSKRQKHNY